MGYTGIPVSSIYTVQGTTLTITCTAITAMNVQNNNCAIVVTILWCVCVCVCVCVQAGRAEDDGGQDHGDETGPQGWT